MLTINKSIHNQPSKHFANKDREVVVIPVGACGTRQGGLWRLLMRARFLRKNEKEAFMLICGILSLILQSRCIRKDHGTKVLLLKRFIVKDPTRVTRPKLNRG
jgi:hypothetical protein